MLATLSPALPTGEVPNAPHRATQLTASFARHLIDVGMAETYDVALFSLIHVRRCGERSVGLVKHRERVLGLPSFL
ncbi:hypothetical protein [Azospirillum himalayense]|uniref:Uncharacterized protein n=1 Tax=Azospirillum himalayense TaxID=654847 RepID=A0ABW0GDC8_9PROT